MTDERFFPVKFRFVNAIQAFLLLPQQTKTKMKTKKKKKKIQLKSAPDIQSWVFFLMQNAHNFFFSLSISLIPNKPYNQPAEMLLFLCFFSPVRFEVADIYKLTTIKENKSKTNEQNCTSSKKFDNL